ncbi:sensor histidine kinase [Bradyrhizobium altum]|uniref:sensor histidine kinase n=1 Tax=Bradyrhizobium altum TaxID=1571202 RepID=UPI0028A2629E|nr:sensor histidine kinase [Bradyrhizobium altum]
MSDGEGAETVSVGPFFEALSAALSEAILEPAGIRCEAVIEDGVFSAVHRHRRGLMVAELMTIAAKHAFPDDAAGLIRIEARPRSGRGCYVVADNGIGTVGPLRGTGGRILEGLARSIGAQICGEAGRKGTTVTVPSGY